MRAMLHSSRGLLGNFIIISLLTCLLTTAFDLNLSPRNFPSRFFRRSIPASLRTSPHAAVGYYQPPPGPVAQEPPPTETDDKKPEASTVITTTVVEIIHHELRQAPTSLSNSSAHGLKNSATVTKTQTQTVAAATPTATAMANRNVVLSTEGLFFAILVSWLQI